MFFVLFAVLVIAGEKKKTDGLLLLESIDAQSIFTRFFSNTFKTLMAGISLIQSDVDLS